MRPEHKFDASDEINPSHCARCGLPRERHRTRTRKRTAYHRDYARRHPKERLILGIDGEGFTDRRGRHLYTYVAASSATGWTSELERRQGVDFESFAEWLLSLPKTALLFGFSLGYDRTKWLESLPNNVIFALTHPELRQGKRGPRAVLAAGYKVNLVSTLLRVKRIEDEESRAVWDLFKFFQCSFVKALRAWGVGTEEEILQIERMKEKRGSFQGITDEEKAYCRSECRLLAMLAKELLQAHEDEGLQLGSYYGPGSTASLILKQAKAKAVKIPDAMIVPVSCAFFGGRFETSRVGPVG
jgi:hypothetical protein